MVTPSSGSVGWRFSPKDEELINYFLARKINGKEEDVRVIGEIDVCKWEPWDLPGQSVLKSDDKEWFFFCLRDQKSASSSRLNRATQKGFWKPTGKDRKIRSKKKEIGVKKSLVFHTGRAPKSQRTYWVMHEYRATSKELDGTHPGQRSFVLCRLFKKDDESVLEANDNHMELPTLSSISNEHSPIESRPNLVSPQVGSLARQEGENKIMSSENFNYENFKTPSQDLEDTMKSTASEPDVNFEILELFADPVSNEISLFNSPELESMGSSLPDNSMTNKIYGNEDVQLDCSIHDFDGCTYDALESLFTNSPDNTCDDQGNNSISVADYESPLNEHMNQYEVLELDDGSLLKSDAQEAELSKMVAELEQYAFTPQSNNLSQASNLPITRNTWTSICEFDFDRAVDKGEFVIFESHGSSQEFDEAETDSVIEASGFSSASVLDHVVYESSSHSNQNTPNRIQIQPREPQPAPAISNFIRQGKEQNISNFNKYAPKRIRLETNLRRRLMPESAQIRSTFEAPDKEDETPMVFTMPSRPVTLHSRAVPVTLHSRPAVKLEVERGNVSEKNISSSGSSLQRPQLSISYKLFLGAASAVVLIFAAYASIRGCLSGRYCSWLA